MLTSDFDYQLPGHLIAQKPASARDESRLLMLNRGLQTMNHGQFRDFQHQLKAGDTLVLNNSKVIPARLRATNPQTGGKFEILLVEENAKNDWWAMMKPGKRARIGSLLQIKKNNGEPSNFTAEVTAINVDGHRRLAFQGGDLFSALEELGELPLPPYIERAPGASAETDKIRYQTVYASPAGSVAAPTAGLHFTDSILQTLRDRGVKICFVTLHVGIGTFAPVKTGEISAHRMHEERYHVGGEAAAEINSAKKSGHRVIAVGTTSLRVLESVAQLHNGLMKSGEGRTRIFIHPPFRFQIVDALLTNFHLPQSTLLMLVSAFAAPEKMHGREWMLAAYAEAVRREYRFFSYGDAMFIE